MKAVRYYIVDVFAGNKYEGNPLAVFLDLDNQLADREMLQMAREINFAESTFVKQDKGQGRYVVRIFTPEYEVPFAGHPSLGTSYIISRFLLPQALPKLTLELPHAAINISIANPEQLQESILYMRQTQPVFGSTFLKELVSQHVKIPLTDLHPFLPVVEISTGLPYILIPLHTLQAMENLRLSHELLSSFLKAIKRHKTNSPDGQSTALFFFTAHTYEQANQYNARMFHIENEKLTEDAATGSANGCLLAYLLHYDKPHIKAVVEQGYQMGRKSLIYLEGSKHTTYYEINIGGYTKLIATGSWYV